MSRRVARTAGGLGDWADRRFIATITATPIPTSIGSAAALAASRTQLPRSHHARLVMAELSEREVLISILVGFHDPRPIISGFVQGMLLLHGPPFCPLKPPFHL